MSKLTPEQKAANKAAQKVRDGAFSARRREYRSALGAAKEKAELSVFAARRDVAGDEIEREIQNRIQALHNIDREIAELEEKKKRIRGQYDLSIQPKREARDAAWQAFRDHASTLEKDVNDQYPDMAGVWSAAGWKIPNDVKAQMEAAREAA